ncbi:uracil-DNA glycosylase family protein [Nakamurella sp. A5-74]|uniref:Uracil-DNA glycosylase family protein n=1 Tax=Nakamurella sp. A5-74 TaxID=3158264 RepID=A0AAU8DQZ1_9ACTN
MTPPAPDALDDLVSRWRAAAPGRFVPAFDPDSGRTRARVLVLLERPAADTVARGDEAVSSEDNPNRSSRAFRDARIASGITRRDYLRWNMIPWADPGPPAVIRSAELDSARDALHELMTALPLLRSIVTLGQPALDGVMRYFTLHDTPVIRTVLAAPHPSPANGRHRAEQHVRIVAALSRAMQI